jgi:hypothetical protein
MDTPPALSDPSNPSIQFVSRDGLSQQVLADKLTPPSPKHPGNTSEVVHSAPRLVPSEPPGSHGSREAEEADYQSINLKKFKIDDFELGMKLGKGKFGNVYLAREKATNYIVALKILNKLEVQRLTSERLIVREIKIHSFVDHPNIIKLYGFFHDDQNIYLILEYAPDGEVYKELKKAVL